MRGRFGYLAGGMGAAVALFSFVVTLEAEVAPAATGPRFDPASVNRTLKGSRLPLVPATTGTTRPAGTPREAQPDTPRTCPVSHDVFSSEVAGRCLA